MGCLLSIKTHENCPENGAHGSGKEYRQAFTMYFSFQNTFCLSFFLTFF